MTTVTALKRAAEEARQRLVTAREEGDAVSFDIETLHRVITSPTVLTVLAGALGDGRQPPLPGGTCGHCGCRLADYFGQLESHAPDCPNFPL